MSSSNGERKVLAWRLLYLRYLKAPYPAPSQSSEQQVCAVKQAEAEALFRADLITVLAAIARNLEALTQ